jgi:hypothetical protein
MGGEKKWGIAVMSRSVDIYQKKGRYTQLGVGPWRDWGLFEFACVRFVAQAVFCTIIVFIPGNFVFGVRMVLDSI